jgi:hypothetical protein
MCVPKIIIFKENRVQTSLMKAIQFAPHLKTGGKIEVILFCTDFSTINLERSSLVPNVKMWWQAKIQSAHESNGYFNYLQALVNGSMFNPGFYNM